MCEGVKYVIGQSGTNQPLQEFTKEKFQHYSMTYLLENYKSIEIPYAWPNLLLEYCSNLQTMDKTSIFRTL